jgi:hypothetical protein
MTQFSSWLLRLGLDRARCSCSFGYVLALVEPSGWQ